MASVVDASAAQVMKKIKAMGEADICMLLGVSDEIKKLEANVQPLQNFLTDAERRRITDKSAQAWVSKLKDALYEAAVILKLCQIEAMDQGDEHASSSAFGSPEGALGEMLHDCLQPFAVSSDKLRGILHPFLFCVQNPGFVHKVGTRIKTLNEELGSIHEGAAEYKFNIHLAPYEQLGRPPTSSAHPRLVELDLVGAQINKNTDELVQKLAVVAIAGQSCTGKSAVPKEVFKSKAITEEFKTKIRRARKPGIIN